MSDRAHESPCQACPEGSKAGRLRRMGFRIGKADFCVALAGNPNTGKSTVFNNLTGLRQHTGNWPGKTITRAEGAYTYADRRYRLVDLPGTYSLLSTSPDEEAARDFVLFGRPDVTVVVADATALERNLNLCLQVMQITGRVVLALNLMDEARAHGLKIDPRGLSRDLGIPVVPLEARQGIGMDDLVRTIHEVASGELPSRPRLQAWNIPGLSEAHAEVRQHLLQLYPNLPPVDWVSLRILEGDASIRRALEDGTLGDLSPGSAEGPSAEARAVLLETAYRLRWQVPQDLHDRLVERIYEQAHTIVARSVSRGPGDGSLAWQVKLDRALTSPWTGFPLMLAVFGAVIWITVSGSNVPSGMLQHFFLDWLYPRLGELALASWMPWWLRGILIDGMFLTTAWVVSVMLPPMAIFFPLFTLLEDFGYLPRVAFNLDRIFQRAGAHGKQALTMSMGYGCNAAGIIATRIIDSPRERLIAILTNNFAICNGRWPTQILMATLFLGALVSPALAGLVAASAVLAVAILGILLTFVTSWALSRTLLRGEPSTFSLELPPYRPPRFWRTLYTSLIDRTLFVLWRAVVFALPAGVVIWLVGNIPIGDQYLASWIMDLLHGPAALFGLTGAVLLAYIIAIPANEIVIPAVLMLSVLALGQPERGAGAGVLFEAAEPEMAAILLQAGWTPVTAFCLMLFSLCHNPCSTTLYTIYKETGQWKWTLCSALLPTAIGFALCGLAATILR